MAADAPLAHSETAGLRQAETGVAAGSGEGFSGHGGAGYASGLAGTGGGDGGTGSGGTGGGGHGDGSGRGIGGFGAPGGPRFLHREVPEYPFAARRHRREGGVLLMVAIDEAGALTKVDVVEASDRIFVNPSLQAVRKSTFLPATKSGRPVACKALLPIRFSLTE
jgi:protein TonB